MNWRIFIARNLKFGRKLTRLHHLNAILFLVLTVTGFVLFSSFYRTTFPGSRVLIKDFHVWIGILSMLPVLFYMPKMTKHLKTLRKRKNHRLNLYTVLSILAALIISGLLLTYHRQIPPQLSSFALIVHDLATWLGVPYVIYHSVTRSQWFKNIGKTRQEKMRITPMLIDRENPILKRRSFLRVLTGGVLAVIFLPLFGNWLKPYLPTMAGSSSPKTDGNKFDPLPQPKNPEPIGGGRKGQFRNYTVTEVPTFTDENWHFTIDGLVKKRQKYNWREFVKLKRSVQVSDFHCVTGWSVYNITWEGIPLKNILQDSGIDQRANYVKFYSGDGVYTDSLTIDQAMQDDMIVAVLMDGELIPGQNGGPVRLITPKMYAYKSVKWLNRIELIENEHVGFWEQRGYEKDAWVRS
ncbi:molybdopterin-dependent oxidoreductase [Virgibacillus byunsanensis]|uniref:Molybdopterin-dependent oxidoreductase n=1 Tax=Virgibacillus byunsanensis TaxID=570945 RepID=A0ABW3LNF5_9BACI